MCAGGRNHPCLPRIYDLSFAPGRHMNPKSPSHVIQSRKYLLQVCCVLDTGNTKLNEMQWKSQFSGETDQGKQAALLRWAQVCNTEMCTLWTQCGETQTGKRASFHREEPEKSPQKGPPCSWCDVWPGICQMDMVMGMGWLPGKRSRAGREHGPLGEGKWPSHLEPWMQVDRAARWGQAGWPGHSCRAGRSLPRGLTLAYSLDDWSHWRVEAKVLYDKIIKRDAPKWTAWMATACRSSDRSPTAYWLCVLTQATQPSCALVSPSVNKVERGYRSKDRKGLGRGLARSECSLGVTCYH